MASAQVTVTITDNVNHSLVQIRDKILIRWGYLGGGTAQDKLNFIQSQLALYLKKEYKAQLNSETSDAALVTINATEASVIDIQ